MKYFELDKEEEAILGDLEKGKLRRVRGAPAMMRELQGAATQTMSKTRTINIRLADRDLQRVKALAVEKGLPYQTFISSLLHQYSQRAR